MTPAEAAGRTGLTLDTLRYYEQEGLIGPVARTVGGQRNYAEDDIFWIGLVTCLRAAGLGIADLREFTGLLRGSGAPTDKVAFLQGHRERLLQRRSALDTALQVVEEKISHYSGEPS